MFESQYHEYLIYDSDGSMIASLIRYKWDETRICGKYDIKLWYVYVALFLRNHLNEFGLIRKKKRVKHIFYKTSHDMCNHAFSSTTIIALHFARMNYLTLFDSLSRSISYCRIVFRNDNNWSTYQQWSIDVRLYKMLARQTGLWSDVCVAEFVVMTVVW